MVYSRLYEMKSTVSHYGMLEKPGCCRMFNTKYLALLSGIYTLVSRSRLEARYQYFYLIKLFEFDQVTNFYVLDGR